MSNTLYKDINAAWAAETANDELQNLEDLRLSKMTEYLSKVRFALTETPAEKQLQADMYTQEALNLEFMLKDLLMLRRNKIIRAAMAQRKPLGAMVLSEEELYNRLLRGFEGHSNFVREALTGMPSSTLTRPTDGGEVSPQEDVVDYVIVRFLRSIDDSIIGIDERTYGPFKKEDLITIPADNARVWLRDGTVVRVATDGGGSD
ncbi:MAG: DNA replication complex subunit Gins51 [Candidatus Thorarchaeota archaeon]